MVSMYDVDTYFWKFVEPSVHDAAKHANPDHREKKRGCFSQKTHLDGMSYIRKRFILLHF